METRSLATTARERQRKLAEGRSFDLFAVGPLLDGVERGGGNARAEDLHGGLARREALHLDEELEPAARGHRRADAARIRFQLDEDVGGFAGDLRRAAVGLAVDLGVADVVDLAGRVVPALLRGFAD